jgi:hypothetical protein
MSRPKLKLFYDCSDPRPALWVLSLPRLGLFRSESLAVLVRLVDERAPCVPDGVVASAMGCLRRSPPSPPARVICFQTTTPPFPARPHALSVATPEVVVSSAIGGGRSFHQHEDAHPVLHGSTEGAPALKLFVLQHTIRDVPADSFTHWMAGMSRRSGLRDLFGPL